MKIQVLDIKGNKTSDITVKDTVFGVNPNHEILKQYLRVFLFNQRQGTSSVKTKAEVSGGGKKPWNQKGTGRARQGSIRSPQFRHGGVAHGPKPKDWSLAFPKKMNKLAILSALSEKFLKRKALVVENLELAKAKTKEINSVLSALGVRGKSLIVTANVDKNLIVATKNNPKISLRFSGILNAYDLVHSQTVIFTKDAVKSIEEKYK